MIRIFKKQSKGINKKNLLLFCALLTVFKLEAVQFDVNKKLEPKNTCECSIIFDELVEKLEQNYVAFHIEIKGDKETSYLLYKEDFGKRAKRIPIAKCVVFLKEFLTYFKDGHLYLGQFPRPTQEQMDDLIAGAEIIDLPTLKVYDYLNENVGGLDEIEGIWFANDSTRYAIIKNKTAHRDFVAFLLTGSGNDWQQGHVKAEFKKLKDGSYDVVYYDKNHYPLYPGAYSRGQQGGAAIRRDLILHMPPISWGKEYPLDTEFYNIIDSKEPRKPIFQIIDSDNILLTIPSHRPEFAGELNGLVEKYSREIAHAKNFILDLRGNEGGSSFVTDVLMPLIETVDKRPERYWIGDEMYVLSSERNITYFKNAEEQGWAPKKLVKRLEDNPGSIVPYQDSITGQSLDDNNKEIEADMKFKEAQGPKNVAILMDGSIVSAGETFIINAMKSQKVTLFGQPTAGCIDYQSTYWVDIESCTELGLFLGYPIFAASNRLPLGGVNETGIAPDVYINDEQTKPIRFIMEYLD